MQWPRSKFSTSYSFCSIFKVQLSDSPPLWLFPSFQMGRNCSHNPAPRAILSYLTKQLPHLNIWLLIHGSCLHFTPPFLMPNTELAQNRYLGRFNELSTTYYLVLTESIPIFFTPERKHWLLLRKICDLTVCLLVTNI